MTDGHHNILGTNARRGPLAPRRTDSRPTWPPIFPRTARSPSATSDSGDLRRQGRHRRHLRHLAIDSAGPGPTRRARPPNEFAAGKDLLDHVLGGQRAGTLTAVTGSNIIGTNDAAVLSARTK